MGKKHITTQTKEEMIKEGEALEKVLENDAERVISKKAAKEGALYIFSSYNNTIITLTDQFGNVLDSRSAGRLGFKGSKKSTPFAASKVAEALGQIAEKAGIRKVHISVKGVGSGRESAVRSIANQGFEILSIKDTTPIPHNGCRQRKPRRL
ncbi:MAG: 30S ribosomal protein S11 [Candidatus Pacebacteria bacterium]|nr:30S ribosomal protein S11 [Candidatus Paceibacterota bacterium]